jgi:hypothetical protein
MARVRDEGVHGAWVALSNAWRLWGMKECMVRVWNEGTRGACVELRSVWCVRGR